MNKDEIVLQVGVKILLKNSDNTYLLLRRSLEKYPDVDGRWDIVGGRIDAGSALIENLKREVLEETGLLLIEENVKLIAAQDILRSAGRHVVRLTYVGRAEGDLVLDGSEHDTYKWLSIDEIKQMDDVDVYFKELLEIDAFS